MDFSIYLKILNDLKLTRTLKKLTLMLQNEPLMDDELVIRVRQAREILGDKVSIVTVSNGTLLSPTRMDELFRAGMYNIEISIDAYNKETYSLVRPGLDFERVFRNAHTLIDYRKGKDVIIRFLRQKANAAEQNKFLSYWNKYGATVHFDEMSNRAGAVRKYNELHFNAPISLYSRVYDIIFGSRPCIFGPFERLAVLWDGRVLVCCQDWRHEVILGNLSKQSLSDIWNGELTNHYRDLLWHGRFEESKLCSKCSNRVSFPGKRGALNKFS